MRDNGLEPPASGEPLILRRTLADDGRSRAFANDQPIGVTLLRQLGDAVVEIVGHGAQLGLVDAATHRAALDEFGRHDPMGGAVADAQAAWQAAVAAHEHAASGMERARREEEDLRAAVAELVALDPQPGEEEQLARTRTMLANAGRVGDALAQSEAELADGHGVDERLGAARRLLARQTEYGPPALKEALGALDRAAAEVAEAVALMARATADLDADPRRLETIEERLYALKSAARKHSTDVAALPALRSELEGRLAALERSGGELAKLAGAVTVARKRYIDAAEALSRARHAAAERLDAAVRAELPPLRLAHAIFRTIVERAPEAAWGRHGIDSVRFEIATNPGQTPGPLGRIASAGELSRFMLALRVALSARRTAATLVFDEVDAGIGGATAAAVGARLRRLGDSMQVLAVTHSPQVAARAHAHFRVSKNDGDSRRGRPTTTRVEELSPGDRREEIARMLAGARITDEARAAADRLMASRSA
jgi:DNA repair protein RecN (Recombination protein N)